MARTVTNCADNLRNLPKILLRRCILFILPYLICARDKILNFLFILIVHVYELSNGKCKLPLTLSLILWIPPLNAITLSFERCILLDFSGRRCIFNIAPLFLFFFLSESALGSIFILFEKYHPPCAPTAHATRA